MIIFIEFVLVYEIIVMYCNMFFVLIGFKKFIEFVDVVIICVLVCFIVVIVVILLILVINVLLNIVWWWFVFWGKICLFL